MLAEFAARYELRVGEIIACLIAGLGFSTVLLTFVPVLVAAASGYLTFTMLLVTLIDSRLMIIPNALSLPAVPLGLAVALTISTETAIDHAIAAAIAAAALYALRWTYFRMRGVTGLGLGDVKLGAAAGAWVGLEQLPLTCLLATGAALAAVLLRRMMAPQKAIGMLTAIPFGSFIAPAIVIVWAAMVLLP